MNSPKATFQKSPFAKDFANMAEKECFQQAAFYTLLELQFSQPEAMDPQMAAAHAQRITGAKQFMKTLLSICDSKESSPSPVTGNLNHKP
jgi:hypothetical protein